MIKSFLAVFKLAGIKPKVGQLCQKMSLVHTLYGPHNAEEWGIFMSGKAGFFVHQAALIRMNGASSPNLYPDFNC